MSAVAGVVPCRAEVGYLVGRLQSLVERDPFRDLSVTEVARSLRVSQRTLNRALQAEGRRGVKALLIDLRCQLIERAIEEGMLAKEEIARLFGFQSRRQLQRWLTGVGRTGDRAVKQNSEARVRPRSRGTTPSRMAGGG